MSDSQDGVVKLKRPVDWEILEALSDGRRDVGVNIAQRLDRNRGYVNTRLPQLADYELVERVGPSERSGLYVITARGIAAYRLRDRYDEEGFEALVDDRADSIHIEGPHIVED